MRKIKLLLAAAFLTVTTSAFSQDNTTVFMKWKLKPNEVISYKTVMSDAGTTNKAFNMGSMMKAMGADSANVQGAQKAMEKIVSAMKPASMVTRLTSKRKGIIDIELITKNDNKTGTVGTDSLNMMAEFFQKMSNGVMLRGAINEDGTIASFYTKGDQKNILALFFELPGKSIKEGDSWPLNVNLASMDQNFICDSAYRRNKVTAIKIERVNGEQIVTLKYDIAEYIKGNFIMPSPMGKESSIPTTTNVTFQGLASFSIEKGRWISYNGLMSYDGTGIMEASNKQNYALVEEK